MPRLSELKAEAQNEHTRIGLVNAVYEAILFCRTKRVTDDRHLAMRGELYRAGQTAGFYCSVPGPLEHERAAFLQVLIP